MARDSAVIKVLLILTFSVHLSLADRHTLMYFYTGVTGLNFPEFIAVVLLDGEQFAYYDSNIREAIPKKKWAQKLKSDEPRTWDSVTERMWAHQEKFKVNVATAMQTFNQTKGIHTWQQMLGCELYDNDTTKGYTQYGCDGEDFMSLDLKTVSWSAAKPLAVMTESKWESKVNRAKYCKDFLTSECGEHLRKFETYSRVTLKKKVVPKVSVFQEHSPSPEVVCHATGFFPKALNITWQKDGEDVHEDVELRETLPNQDGSFQKRSILKVPAEELQKHTYTCMVQHSSLEKELVREVPKGGATIPIIAAVIAALIALVAVGARIVVWKKKNSGFKPVPAKPSSEGDSSTNNS
ncbi:BOLA class I histocompatibility antigen, alpha chain BL3-7-like [Clarias gariepinus]|uniref:BOLA class I histocompatibility antigen, alpha chain BL3-7-like n=1 Tax=Clarias gariepinus TaxID=13013 RepID=UPI00234E2E13|nr:BOLA class I histocompatibility antigen, alpha chain BL3-7-like [Clarias gariepinus]